MNPSLFFLALAGLSASNLVFAQSAASLETHASGHSMSLPDLVVYRKNNLENISYEADHSLSLTKLDIETVQRTLASGDGVVVNFDLEFAKKTAVMNAEGKHVVDVLIGALKYMKRGLYEIQVRGRASGSKLKTDSLSTARAQSLLSILERRNVSLHQFSLAENFSNTSRKGSSESSDRVDVWSFSITQLVDHAKVDVVDHK